MPRAFSIKHGLDWNTEIESFWAWLHDARLVIEGDGEARTLVRDLVAGQRERIEELAAEQPDPAQARFALTLAVSLVGFNYASNQKLLNALEETGALGRQERIPGELRRSGSVDAADDGGA